MRPASVNAPEDEAGVVLSRTLSIRAKIVLLSGLCLVSIIALLVWANNYQAQRNALRVAQTSEAMLTASANSLLASKVAEKASELQRRFDKQQTVAVALADQLLELRAMGIRRHLAAGDLRADINTAIKRVFDSNPKLLGVWVTLEPDVLDGQDRLFVGDQARGSNEAGRVSSYWSRPSGQPLNTAFSEAEITRQDPGADGTPWNDWYRCPQRTAQACLLAPYVDKIDGKRVLLTTLSVPLTLDGVFIGAVGVDLSLDSLQQMAEAAQQTLSNGKGSFTIVASNGLVAGSSNIGLEVGTLRPPAMSADPGARDDKIAAINTIAPVEGAAPWTLEIELPKAVVLADSIALETFLTLSGEQGSFRAIAIGISAALVGLLLMAFVANGLTRPIGHVTAMLGQITSGEGDLTQRLHYAKKEELGALVSALNRFLDTLAPSIAKVKQSITQTRAMADQSFRIASLTRDGMLNQFRQIDQVATASNEMSASAQVVANNAASAAQATKDADVASLEGISIVEQSIRDAHTLAQRVLLALDEAQELLVNSDEIGSVLDVIRNVAQQTNLLALNAAIEAARAGEQGRGFAVVADEVRNLSRRTQDSVEEIRDAIARMQSVSRGVAATMRDSNVMAQKNAEQIYQAATSLSRIRGFVSIITSMNLHIATAAQEQSVVAEDINRNIAAIRNATENLNQQASESAEVCTQLNELASMSSQVMDQFRVT